MRGDGCSCPLTGREPVFDLIYIDGEHHAASALEDAVLTFPLLKVGGAMVFDDCGISNTNRGLPAAGVQAFLNVFLDRVRIEHIGWQVHVIKTAHDCEDLQCRCRTSAEAILQRDLGLGSAAAAGEN